MDPYKVLGVSPSASDEEIKKAYRALTKKYHPDLNPGDPSAEKKYAEINAAYDAIQKGTASPYGQSEYSSSGTSWNSWQQAFWEWQAGQNQNDTVRTEYRAALNYLQNGMYNEALNALSQVSVSERDGEWYYLSAKANAYLSNRVAAMEDARRACEIEPDNEKYQRLYNNLSSGGNYYDNYTVQYSSGLDFCLPGMALCTTGFWPCFCFCL